MNDFFKYSFLAAALALGANSTASASLISDDSYEEEQALDYANSVEVNDPLEPMNRAIFEFNSVVDDFLLEPVATTYAENFPEWGQNRVGNFLGNLSEPITFVNSVLQAKDEKAFTSLWRFLINSTFGLLGTFDAATEVGLKKGSEGFGQTLYVWGMTDSPYLVLPLLGPSTLRDGVGGIADFYTSPFNYNPVLDSHIRNPIYVAEVIDTRAGLLPVTENLDNAALDRYVTYRSTYFQNFESRAER